MQSVITEPQRRFWLGAFLLWVVGTLTFMAAMGITAGVFAAASLYVLWRSPEVWRGFPWHTISGFAWACLLVMLTSALSLLAAYLDPPLGVPPDGWRGITKFHYFLYPVFTALVIRQTGGDPHNHALWKALRWMILLVSVVTVLQHFGGWIFPERWLSHRFFRPMAYMPKNFHGQGFMMFHLSFAAVMCFCTSYVAAHWIWNRRMMSIGKRWAGGALAVLATLATYFTFSRAVWGALVAMFVLLAFLRRPRWGLAAMLGASLLALALFQFNEAFRQRVNDTWAGTRGREIVWGAAMEMIQDRPLVGVGFSKTGQYSHDYARRSLGGVDPWFSSHAHNNLLDVAAATGIPGVLAFAAWWLVLFSYMWRNFREAAPEARWLGAATLAAAVAFHVNGLTQVNFWDAKTQHTLMLWAGLVLAQRAWIRKGHA
ncbi:MAG: O-antigen ligase family protein [Bdellovibrionales bacterium]|nr:O-antigen ligase family protein [Bdellovibrionales bacterium]